MSEMKPTDILMLVAFGCALLFAGYLTLPPALSGSRQVMSVQYAPWPLGRL